MHNDSEIFELLARRFADRPQYLAYLRLEHQVHDLQRRLVVAQDDANRASREFMSWVGLRYPDAYNQAKVLVESRTLPAFRARDEAAPYPNSAGFAEDWAHRTFGYPAMGNNGPVIPPLSYRRYPQADPMAQSLPLNQEQLEREHEPATTSHETIEVNSSSSEESDGENGEEEEEELMEIITRPISPAGQLPQYREAPEMME